MIAKVWQIWVRRQPDMRKRMTVLREYNVEIFYWCQLGRFFLTSIFGSLQIYKSNNSYLIILTFTDLPPKILRRWIQTWRILIFLKTDQAFSSLAPGCAQGGLESSKKSLPSAVYRNHLWNIGEQTAFSTWYLTISYCELPDIPSSDYVKSPLWNTECLSIAIWPTGPICRVQSKMCDYLSIQEVF